MVRLTRQKTTKDHTQKIIIITFILVQTIGILIGTEKDIMMKIVLFMALALEIIAAPAVVIIQVVVVIAAPAVFIIPVVVVVMELVVVVMEVVVVIAAPAVVIIPVVVVMEVAKVVLKKQDEKLPKEEKLPKDEKLIKEENN